MTRLPAVLTAAAAAAVSLGVGTAAAPADAATVPTHGAVVRAVAVKPKPRIVVPRLHRVSLAARREHVRQSRANRAVRIALAQRGRPYVWGATGPRAFDCSGLTSYAYRRAGTRIPRIADAQYHRFRHVSFRQLRPGDLVFMQRRGYAYHVGMFIGHGKVVSAPHTGAVVRVSPLSWGWNGAVRVS
jgi:cell wall-associated NlpC family hydrolase